MKNNKEIFQSLYNVSRETIHKLDIYHDFLLFSQHKTNLIGKGSKEEVYLRHFADSAKIFYLIESLLKGNDGNKLKICDIGSGAGFPGAVVQIFMDTYNLENSIDLVESIKKKCNFLELLKVKIDSRFNILNSRAEFLNEKYDIIMARAVSPLKGFFPNIRKIVKKNSTIILPKGNTWENELNEVKNDWKFNLNIVKNNITLDKTGGVTLIIKNFRKK